MTTTYNWTTPRGAKIEATITVNHITRETVDADGFEVDVKCDEWHRTIDKMLVNGKPAKMAELTYEQGTHCILIDRIGKNRVLVAIPQNVVDAIYGEQNRATDAQLEVAHKFEKMIDAHRAMVEKAMNP